MMIKIIFIYISIGMLFCLMIDYAYIQKDRGNIHFQHMPESGLSNTDRIITVAIWPLGLLMAIRQIIKDFKNKL